MESDTLLIQKKIKDIKLLCYKYSRSIDEYIFLKKEYDDDKIIQEIFKFCYSHALSVKEYVDLYNLLFDSK